MFAAENPHQLVMRFKLFQHCAATQARFNTSIPLLTSTAHPQSARQDQARLTPKSIINDHNPAESTDAAGTKRQQTERESGAAGRLGSRQASLCERRRVRPGSSLRRAPLTPVRREKKRPFFIKASHSSRTVHPCCSSRFESERMDSFTGHLSI